MAYRCLHNMIKLCSCYLVGYGGMINIIRSASHDNWPNIRQTYAHTDVGRVQDAPAACE